MSELDALAAELRSELGTAPPPSEAQWRRLQSDARFVRPRRWDRRHWVGGFALAAAAVLLWLFALRDTEGGSRQLAANAAPLQRSLEDRSVLTLAKESRGQLEESDAKTSFRLESGKVSLDVTPRQDRTFEVLAAGYVITVVGTRFEVWVGNTGSVVVEVSKGIVTVIPPRGGREVRLEAGERLEGDAEGRVSVRHPGAPAREGAEVTADLPAASPITKELPAEPRSPAESATRSGSTGATGSEWRVHFRARRYAEALASAREAGVDGMLGELDARALSDLADVARLGGDSSLNVRVLRTLRSRFPGTLQASRAAFLLGRALALAGNSREAAGAFEAHLAEDPDGAHAVEALGRLMELYSAMGDRARARKMAERYLERAPTGPYQRLARSLVLP